MISQSILNPSSHFEQKLLSVYILGALQTQIFTKTLTFPILRNNIYNPGDLINLLQIDTYQASNFFYNCIMVVLTPIQFFSSLYVYFDTMGYESIPGGVSAFI